MENYTHVHLQQMLQILVLFKKKMILWTYIHKRKCFKDNLKIFYFEKEYISACNFCNGRDHNVGKVEAAIQTKNPLEFKKVYKLVCINNPNTRNSSLKLRKSYLVHYHKPYL